MVRFERSHPIEEAIGIKYYLTRARGTGGSFRSRLSDFIVEEHVDLRLFRSGSYAVYKCVKEGIDTFEAVEILSKELEVPVSRISYGGLKDAKAISVQFMTVYKPVRTPKIIECGKAKYELVGWARSKLISRHVLSNTFKIVVRNAKPGFQDDVAKCLLEIEELGGLYNYYGHQRFGTRRPSTHKVGAYLLSKDWENAVLEIVGRPSPYESCEVREARRVFEETLDAEAALEIFPERMRYERIVLEELSRTRDYLKALNALPKNILRFYLEAYQSYIYNLIISRRVEYGITPREYLDGDLVGSPNGIFRKGVGKGFLGDSETVLIPLPGSGAKIPSGEAGRLYLEVLREEGVGERVFQVDELSLKFVGEAFRPSRMIVKNLGWRILGSTSYFLKFTLDRGCYATILLREVIKGDPRCY